MGSVFVRRHSVVGLLLSMSLAVSACGSEANSASEADTAAGDRPSVVTAFYPLQWMTEQVAGEAASVTSLTPKGSEPHDLTLDAKSLERLRDADVVIYLGEEFQPEVQKAIEQLPASVRRVDALKVPGIDLLDVANTEADDHDHEHAHEHEDSEEHGTHDPHVWLDPVRMQAVAKAIGEAMSAVDSARATTFSSNVAGLESRLASLNGSTAAKLANCQRRTLVTGHAAFRYFANRYGLTQLSITGISPDEDPDPKSLQSIAAAAKSAGATTVYFEDALPSKLAETVAREIGAETDLLSALEFQPEAGDYLTVMDQNTDRLVKGLSCAP
jgi:zinc transport system substrate-binding protein